jgi:hypothetical protein
MEQERDFKGVWIPKEIWSNTELTLIEKIILVEIDSLDVNEEGCYASNKYLADFCNCTETTISTSINKLIKMEYLYLVKFDGRRRYLKSAIKTFKVSIQNIEKQTLNNLKADFKKLKAININNNIDNNIKENNIKERFKKPTLEDIEEYCKSRNNNIDPKKFYDYYSVNNWKDKDGKQVKSWKQKVITWEGRTRSNNVPEWFDQNLDIEKASKEEVNEMKNILNI